MRRIYSLIKSGKVCYSFSFPFASKQVSISNLICKIRFVSGFSFVFKSKRRFHQISFIIVIILLFIFYYLIYNSRQKSSKNEKKLKVLFFFCLKYVIIKKNFQQPASAFFGSVQLSIENIKKNIAKNKIKDLDFFQLLNDVVLFRQYVP